MMVTMVTCIFSKRDEEEIHARETAEGNTAAMVMVLNKITKRKESWFTDLITALRDADNQAYMDIVVLIEPLLGKGLLFCYSM